MSRWQALALVVLSIPYICVADDKSAIENALNNRYGSLSYTAADSIPVISTVEELNDYLTTHVSSAHKQKKEYFIPYDFDPLDLTELTLAAGASALIIFGDEEFKEHIGGKEGNDFGPVASVGDYLGGIGAVALPLTGYVVGILVNNQDIKDTSTVTFRAVLISTAVTTTLKYAFQRKRPDDTNDAKDFQGPRGDFKNNSFPSWHTASAFAMATVVAEKYGEDNFMVPVIAYSLAGFTAWSRVYDNKHWLSDTVMGAVIGHLVAKHVLNAKLAKKGIYIAPGVDPETGTFMVNLTYGVQNRGHSPQSNFNRCAKGKDTHFITENCFRYIFSN
jgi:membrane-associated phospholipid phosphatase